MSDDDSFLAGHKAPVREPKQGELLFEFLAGYDRWICELRDQGAWGIEAQFLKNEEFEHSFRWPTREMAIAWAEDERKRLERGRV